VALPVRNDQWATEGTYLCYIAVIKRYLTIFTVFTPVSAC